jgi:hypothetical protein
MICDGRPSSFDETRAQRFMSRDERIQPMLQCRLLQRTLQTDSGNDVVTGAVRHELIEKPQPLLASDSGSRPVRESAAEWE